MWRRGSPGPGRPLLVAHRGGAALAGGDPVEGVRRLVALGADMVELDVRTTADGVPVVHHDPRAGGVPLRGRSLAAHAAAGARLPTLEAFLEAAAGRIALDVELKEPGGEERIMGAVRAGADPARVVVTSFADAALAAVRRAAPWAATGLLVGRRAGWRTPALLARDALPFGRLRACGADFLAPSRALLATGLARRAARHGVGLLVWTVDDPALVERYLADPRVLGVVTGSPRILRDRAGAAARSSPPTRPGGSPPRR